MEMVLVCFVRLRSKDRLKRATRIIMNLLHEFGFCICMQRNRLRPSGRGDHADRIGHWKGRDDLGPIIEHHNVLAGGKQEP